ncbi:accessory factor UbiK family protein [Paeniroseomonas aquatica]|uniref:accessory factor UbiK family protein n=1 Tax=Paeniroseomonas aquatica TaxID=373043 RepID=UPI00361CD9A5
MSDTSGGKKRGGLFDDLAGVAGGAFSALAGVRGEVEAAVRSQVDQMVQRLDLVKREDLDAAMELARRAREAQEVLEARVAALEAKLGQAAAPAAGPEPDLAPDRPRMSPWKRRRPGAARPRRRRRSRGP